MPQTFLPSSQKLLLRERDISILSILQTAGTVFADEDFSIGSEKKPWSGLGEIAAVMLAVLFDGPGLGTL